MLGNDLDDIGTGGVGDTDSDADFQGKPPLDSGEVETLTRVPSRDLLRVAATKRGIVR